ncbi:ScbR family autoregulator-binding transcription factor [Streptomyces djakartensis]|uniref:Gamma-butyrolactone-binding protein n=1 Tax=Streptomyces djakartensis TaxID=68193 RepID=A0ABQ2ZVP1_9ACTN|nr:ScbR family autoregulator-binding transcription factor [Streptomyces djakartensis]GGY24168.1 gamma-butyrolactone-binding protein [Streptomyces djakartensis]
MALQDRAIRTRRVILEAAASVFEEHGYEATKITDIVDRAKVTKGALYHHFDSKEALALAVLEAQLEEVPPLPAQASRLQEAIDFGMVFAHRLTYDPIVRASVRLTLEDTGQALKRSGPYDGWADLSARSLQQAKTGGELLPHVDPDETAMVIVAAYAGINLVARFTGSREEHDKRAALLYRHLVPSIAVPSVLAALDMAPGRGRRVIAEAERAQSTRRAQDGPLVAQGPQRLVAGRLPVARVGPAGR